VVEMRMRLFVLVAVAIAMIFAVALPASAAGATVVRGVQTPVASGPCFDANAEFSTTMDGGLIGCWWIDMFVVTGEHPSGSATFSGTEHFTGCLDTALDGNCDGDDPAGTFSTTFTFTAKFDADGNEIHGRCNHPIVSGTGGFTGITGVVNFTDDVSTGLSPYIGNVRLS
jgi:hypothetical protein